MEFKRITALISAASFSMIGGAATAATSTFDLTCSWGDTGCVYGNQSSFSLTDNGVTGTFSAGAFNPLQAADIGRWSTGVGASVGWYDNHQVDGRGLNEFINMAFDTVVTITQLVFSYADSNDHFYWLNDNDSSNSVSAGDSFESRTSVSSTVSGLSRGPDNFFAIAAIDNNDDWKLTSITVSYESPPAIPLPAAGWMLLAAVGGLASVKRRKKA